MSTFEKAGRFDESLCSSTDRDLMIRFLQHFHIDSIALIPDLSVLHYADSDLTVTNLKDNKHRGLDRFYEKFIILYSFEVLQQSLKRAEEYFGYPNRKQIEKLYRQNKTILVTGVCGFIGSSLAKELVNYDYVVYGVDNLSSGSIDRIKLLQTRDNFHFIECDLSDDNQVTHLFEESSYDFVYHLAALPRVNFSFEFPEESYRANVIATAQLVNALKTHNVQRFIFTSSSSVYGMQQQVMMNEGLPINPLSPYALQKAESENTIDKILSESETDCIILRLFNVYGYNSIETNSYSTLIHKWISEMT